MKFIKRHRVLTTIVVVVILSALVILICDPFLYVSLGITPYDKVFMPLRNTPDEILVYKDCEAVRLLPDDEAFKEIYQGLRDYESAGRGKDFFAEPSLYTDYAPEFFTEGIAVRCIYHKTQRGVGYDLLGKKNRDKFKEIYFLFSELDEDSQYSKEDCEMRVFYADIPHKDSRHGYLGNYKHPWLVEEYIKSLDISGFPSAKDVPLPYRMRTGQ